MSGVGVDQGSDGFGLVHHFNGLGDEWVIKRYTVVV